MAAVNWDDIKEIWQTGIGSLEEKSKTCGVALPQIMLHARREKWGNRASETDFEKNVKDLDFDSVSLAYRQSMLKMKKMCDAILEAIAVDASQDLKIDALDTLSKIMTRIMPLSVNAAEYHGLAEGGDEEIKKIIREQQIKAIKSGDVKMLMFLGKQHLGQREQLDLFTKDIVSGMDPKKAAEMYQRMLKGETGA